VYGIPKRVDWALGEGILPFFPSPAWLQLIFVIICSLFSVFSFKLFRNSFTSHHGKR